MRSEPLIVVAEDEADSARLLGYHLRRAGYEPIFAEDGMTALNETIARRPALVLLDVMMPNLDGFQVCRMLKTSPTTKQIPIIFLSALGDTGDKVRGLDLGAVDYVTKPFNMPELLARIRTTLHRQHD
jgi:DNA-binding response OmpR family regulator